MPDNTACDEVAGAARGGHAVTIVDTKDPTITDQDFGNFEGGAVSGMKFDDQDKGGDPADPGEPPLEGWTIEAYDDDGGPTAGDTPDNTGTAEATAPPR